MEFIILGCGERASGDVGGKRADTARGKGRGEMRGNSYTNG